MFISSQIVNLKMIRDVLELRVCYQCGGETLVPVVKHLVSDRIYLFLNGNTMVIQLFNPILSEVSDPIDHTHPASTVKMLDM